MPSVFTPNPTLNEQSKKRLEVHILDFDQEIYGETLELSFIEDGLETLDLHGCQGEAFNILNLSNCKNLKHFKLY